jgi:hypothetical protein
MKLKFFHSEHKGQVVVSKAVTDVHAAVHSSIASVESIVTGPQLVSHDGNSLCYVAQHRPALIRLITLKTVEEVFIVGGFMASN